MLFYSSIFPFLEISRIRLKGIFTPGLRQAKDHDVDSSWWRLETHRRNQKGLRGQQEKRGAS